MDDKQNNNSSTLKNIEEALDGFNSGAGKIVAGLLIFVGGIIYAKSME